MSIRTMTAMAALLGALAAPVGAQQHEPGMMQDQEPGMMMSCPMMQGMMMQHMMQGMMMQDSMMQQMMGGMAGPMMGSRMTGSPMMGAMGPGPEMLLAASDALELTPDQTERLEAIRDRLQDEHRVHMSSVMTAHGDASAAVEGDAPDLDAYARALNEAADQMVLAHVAMTRSALEARKILTPEQLEKLDELPMHGMRGGMMPRGGTSGHDRHH